jgi:TusA-related sulfurtransferase
MSGAVKLLDITADVCPMTYVRVKLALEDLPEGGLLEVVLKGAEPVKNVPRSAREDGHEVLAFEPIDGVRHRLLLKAHHAE